MVTHVGEAGQQGQKGPPSVPPNPPEMILRHIPLILFLKGLWKEEGSPFRDSLSLPLSSVVSF